MKNIVAYLTGAMEYATACLTRWHRLHDQVTPKTPEDTLAMFKADAAAIRSCQPLLNTMPTSRVLLFRPLVVSMSLIGTLHVLGAMRFVSM